MQYSGQALGAFPVTRQPSGPAHHDRPLHGATLVPRTEDLPGREAHAVERGAHVVAVELANARDEGTRVVLAEQPARVAVALPAVLRAAFGIS